MWSTKDRLPLLNDDVRSKVFAHIISNAREKGIFIEAISGYREHVHCLISLANNQSIEQIMQLIKGESSFWINRQKLTPAKFGWQDEYFVTSVSESNLESVRRYIANQEKHHRKVPFGSEFDSFMKRAGFVRFNDVQ